VKTDLTILDSDKKGGFTIIELLIAIAILVLIMLYLSSLFHISYETTSSIANEAESKKYENRVIELIYADVLESKDIIPTANSKNFDFLDLREGLSLHGIENPFVKWRAIKGDGGKIYLVRAESNKNFDFANAGDDEFYLDVIVENIERFKVITDREFVELYLKLKGKKEIHLKFFGGKW